MDPITLASGTLALLAPSLAKAGGVVVDKAVESLPEAAGKLWEAISAKFEGRPAAQEAAKDLAAAPDDADNQAAFRKELRKALSDDPEFLAALSDLLSKAQQEHQAQGGVNVSVGGSVSGNIVIGNNNRVNDKK